MSGNALKENMQVAGSSFVSVSVAFPVLCGTGFPVFPGGILGIILICIAGLLQHGRWLTG